MIISTQTTNLLRALLRIPPPEHHHCSFTSSVYLVRPVRPFQLVSVSVSRVYQFPKYFITKGHRFLFLLIRSSEIIISPQSWLSSKRLTATVREIKCEQTEPKRRQIPCALYLISGSEHFPKRSNDTDSTTHGTVRRETIDINFNSQLLNRVQWSENFWRGQVRKVFSSEPVNFPVTNYNRVLL